VGLAGAQFGEDAAHRAGKHVHELVEKWLVQPERAAVADGPAQDAAQDVVAIRVARLNAVGDGKAQRADVVGDHAEGDVDFLLLRPAGAARDGERAGIFFAAELFDLVKDRAEDVGLVVRDFRVCEVGESFRALDDRGHALEAHAGIDVLLSERDKLDGERGHPGRVSRHPAGVVLSASRMLAGAGWKPALPGLCVELDEDEVPDLDALGGAFVDEGAARVAGGREIDVEFRARAARAGLAHHPEVVGLVAVDDVNVRVESGGAEFLGPEIPRRLVALGGVALAGLVNGRVEPLRREAPAPDDQLPRPVDGFLFEIIAEAPVAEHLEKRVVIRVEADVIEVVVLAAGADALLRVGRAARRVRALDLAEENGHELVHARVGEEQIRTLGQQARRRHDRVALRFEEIEKGSSNLGAGHHGGVG